MGKQLPFYCCSFDENSEHDYAILPHCIIVNEKYIHSNKELATLNTAINLNISYEIDGESVYFGTIKSDQRSAILKKSSEPKNSNFDKPNEQKNGVNSEKTTFENLLKNKKTANKTLNSPEEIERFYEYVVDQIDLEFDGLREECDGLFLTKNDFFIEQYIRNNSISTDQDPVGLMNDILCKRAQLNNQSHIQQLQKILHSTSAKHGAKLIYSLSTAFVYQFREDIILDNLMKILSEQSNERVKHQIIDLMYRFTLDGNKKILDQLHEWIQTSETIEGGEIYKTEFLDTTISEEKTLQVYSKLGIPILSINEEFIIEKNGKIDSPELREWFNKTVLNGTKENYETVHKRYQKKYQDNLMARVRDITESLESKFNETKSTIISAPRSEFDNEPEEKARGVTNNIPKTNRQSSDTSIKFLDLKDLWLPVSINNKLVMLEIDEKEKTWYFKIGKPSDIFAPVLALYPQQTTGNNNNAQNLNKQTFTFIDPLLEQISKIKLDDKSTRESDYPELGEVIKKAIDFRLMCKLGQNGIDTDFDRGRYETEINGIMSQINNYGVDYLRNIEGLENEVSISNDGDISYINKSRKGVSWLVKTYILAEKRRKTELTDMIQWTFMDKEEGVNKFKKLRILAKKHNYDEILKQRNEYLLYNDELTTKYDVIKLLEKIRDIEKVTGLDDWDLYCTVISDEAREKFNEAYPDEFLNRYVAAYRYVADLFQFEKEYNEQLATHQKTDILETKEEVPVYDCPEVLATKTRFFDEIEKERDGNAFPQIKKIIMSYGDMYIRGDRQKYRERIAKDTGVIKCLHQFNSSTRTNLYEVIIDPKHPLRVALMTNPFRNTTQSIYNGTFITSGNLDTVINDYQEISTRRGCDISMSPKEIVMVFDLIFQLKKEHIRFSYIHTQIINKDQKDNIIQFQNHGKEIISWINGGNDSNNLGLNQYDRDLTFSRIGKDRLEQLLSKLGEDEFDGLCDRLIEFNKENALRMLLENDKSDSASDLVLNRHNQPLRNGINSNDLNVFFELFASTLSCIFHHEEQEESDFRKNAHLTLVKHPELKERILGKIGQTEYDKLIYVFIERNRLTKKYVDLCEQINIKNPQGFFDIVQKNKKQYDVDFDEEYLADLVTTKKDSIKQIETLSHKENIYETLRNGGLVNLPGTVDPKIAKDYLLIEQIFLSSYLEYLESEQKNAYIAASEGSLLSRLHGPSSDAIIKFLLDYLQNLSKTGYENKKEEISYYLDRFGLIVPRNKNEQECYIKAGNKINAILNGDFGISVAEDFLIDFFVDIAYQFEYKHIIQDYKNIQRGRPTEIQGPDGITYSNADIKTYLDIEQAILTANREIWSLREKEFDNLMNKKSINYKRHKDSPEAFFAKLYNKNPKDLVALAQFLYTGGEFLNEIELETHYPDSLDRHPEHSEGSKSSTFRLSEILACSNTLGDDMKNISDLSGMQGIVQKLHEGPVNLSRHSQPISSSINGQDKGTMIYLKEGAQNSLDAIRKKHRTTGKNEKDCVDINFGTHGERRITQIKDPVGMSVFEIFNYLLPVYKSGKTGEDTGMFGQGFYSYAIGAKEVRIKTSSGNGKTIYLTLQPIYNTAENINNRQIIDFDVQCFQSNEQFTGTTVERIDENEGITANLIAMLGVNQMQKYIGTVDDIPIKYNGELLVKPGDKKILGATTIPKYGELQLISQRNTTGKLSKDCLYIKDLDRLMLDCFPERIQRVITDNNLIINIPSKIHLNKTRNAIAHEQQVVHQIIQPYLYRLVMDYILNQFCHNSLKIPMLPEDYLYNSHYFFSEQYKSNVEDIIKSYNNSPEDFGSIWPKNKQLLLDKTNFSSFITGVTFNNKGTQTSLREIRNLSIQKQFDRLKQLGAMSARAEGYINRAKDEHDKQKEKNEKITDFPAALGIRPDRFNEFLAYCQKLVDILIGEGKVAVLCRDLGPGSAAGFFGKTIIFNIVDLLKYKEIFNSFDEPNSQFNRKVIDTITHELSHYEEGEVYGSKRSTHEKDLETVSSFESIQRKFITKLLRHFHSQLH